MRHQSSRTAAFAQADARPMFCLPKSASSARSQLWLGLPNGRFQSGGSPRITAAIARRWSSCGELRAVWPKSRKRLSVTIWERRRHPVVVLTRCHPLSHLAAGLYKICTLACWRWSANWSQVQMHTYQVPVVIASTSVIWCSSKFCYQLTPAVLLVHYNYYEYMHMASLQCFDIVVWVTGRAPGL